MNEIIDKAENLKGVIIVAIAVILTNVIIWLLLRINKYIFSKFQKKGNGLHLTFFEHISAAVISIACVIIALSAFGGIGTVWHTLLGGTAVISAVVVFAAQDTIKDILAGLMISVHRPFEIGNRIVLEDGTAGIVENITLRHVVLIGMDGVRVVIPNSKLNAMKLTNYSVESERSVQLRFLVGYDSDMELVKRVTEQAVEDSPYSIPGRKSGDGTMNYSPVYFTAFKESALEVSVMIYYKKEYTTELVTDDINTRVRDAFINNNIEIPYNYLNIIPHPDNREKES